MVHASEDEVEFKKSLATAAAAKAWHHGVYQSVDAAVGYLNIDPVQGAGEAIIIPRSDGQVDLVYFI
ncbi:hypothetical protein ACFVH0_00370 [Streptomyces sp. NPDC127117]|uniref:hypothetical protein n=1 Tax=Streptomyces sp. NPDC127117 TaxID=3345368 RepID=UPI00362B311F